MGLLRSGDILPWNTLWKKREIIKNRGIDQFLVVYNRNKDNDTPRKAFGEELELIMVIKDGKKYKLYCGSENVIGKSKNASVEYARYMVEISNMQPYDEYNFTEVERKIIENIANIEDVVKHNVSVIMISCFPNMNYSYFYDTKTLTDDVTYSLNFPDNGITHHKRFEFFTKNIWNRRGRKQEGYIEIMDDSSKLNEDIENYIHIDSMGQGMGCCGLQVTIQGKSIDEARYIYDMMGILGPLLLRLTRATPCANGRLLKTETRWDMLSMSVDCRTNNERGNNFICSNGHNDFKYEVKIPKSRSSCFDFFISNDSRNLEEYNDTNAPVHSGIYEKLIKKNIDTRLAKHVASLFIRDPIISYEETNESTFDDFENIQSSNWRSVRFKIPIETYKKDLRGWKVEVRSMEMQATPFENTAYIYFTYLIVQAVLQYDLNFYIPISKVDTNFTRANQFARKASDYKTKLEEDNVLFYYRTNIEDKGVPEIREGTIADIFLGNSDTKGVMYYVHKIIDERFADHAVFLRRYIDFIKDKINNKYLTLSDWIRKFIITHNDYSNDSVVKESILDDLIETIIRIKKQNTVEYLKNED